jgi:hypothetical protein
MNHPDSILDVLLLQVTGAKKWILFPPHVTPPGVHPSVDGADVATPVSLIEWFLNFYDDARNAKVGTHSQHLRAGSAQGAEHVRCGLSELCRSLLARQWSLPEAWTACNSSGGQGLLSISCLRACCWMSSPWVSYTGGSPGVCGRPWRGDVCALWVVARMPQLGYHDCCRWAHVVAGAGVHECQCAASELALHVEVAVYMVQG